MHSAPWLAHVTVLAGNFTKTTAATITRPSATLYNARKNRCYESEMMKRDGTSMSAPIQRKLVMCSNRFASRIDPLTQQVMWRIYGDRQHRGALQPRPGLELPDCSLINRLSCPSFRSFFAFCTTYCLAFVAHCCKLQVLVRTTTFECYVVPLF